MTWTNLDVSITGRHHRNQHPQQHNHSSDVIARIHGLNYEHDNGCGFVVRDGSLDVVRRRREVK